jgi:DNA-binding winged helix-turn-helix (wHTH) protein
VVSLASKLGGPGREVLRVGCAFVETGRARVSLRFGPFAFDASSRELRSGDRLVPLSPKAYELLALLLEVRPRALSKAELRDRLWPDSFVGETSLPRVIGEVRRALGDSPAEGRFLRTVQRFGYAFAGRASEDRVGRQPAGGSCALMWGGQIVPLAEGENLIGRDPDCTVRIPSGLVSRHHARVVVASGRATLEDLGSKNGTRLRGHPASGPVHLGDGDEIRIGPALLVYCAAGSASTRSRS